MEKIMELVKTYTDVEIASKLLHASSQFKIYHWQSLNGDFHRAVEFGYEEISSQLDSLVETIQGKTKSLLKGYKTYPFIEDNNPIKFSEEIISCLESYRSKLKSPKWDNIDNQIQTLVDTLEQVIYKITFLK